jgi:uncharacterized phage protein (TIGR02216 family)
MKFPWAELMGLGLGDLRLAPEAFWAMSPRELFAAAGVRLSRPMGREALDDLMARFPDEVTSGKEL